MTNKRSDIEFLVAVSLWLAAGFMVSFVQWPNQYFAMALVVVWIGAIGYMIRDIKNEWEQDL